MAMRPNWIYFTSLSFNLYLFYITIIFRYCFCGSWINLSTAGQILPAPSPAPPIQQMNSGSTYRTSSRQVIFWSLRTANARGPTTSGETLRASSVPIRAMERCDLSLFNWASRLCQIHLRMLIYYWRHLNGHTLIFGSVLIHRNATIPRACALPKTESARIRSRQNDCAKCGELVPQSLNSTYINF